MSWKKYFNPVDLNSGLPSGVKGNDGKAGMYASRYSSWLPEVYSGSPDRIMRYYQYDAMDRDLEINAALDIIAEFCTQEEDTNLPFKVEYNDTPSNPEVKVIQQSLQKWCKLNELPRRIFKIFRSTLKYGDQLFIRDPETKKLYWVDPYQVEKVLVNESNGKKIEQYFIKNLDLHLKDLAATSVSANQDRPYGTGAIMSDYTNPQSSAGFKSSSSGYGPDSNNAIPIDAQHVLHISMSEGMETTWPFGNSILDPIFKVYKQKELLEDAIIIYRTQRAPERRVFYIDVGNMPSHLAMQFVERVKTEIHQRRIPSASGGSTNVIDSAYNPLSTNEDYFFPQTAEGRGSKVETLPGGTNLGEIDDLKYFTNKLIRGLRIPSSYLPSAAQDEGQSQFNDGRVGTAYIQELRFNKYCERLQNLVTEEFDQEFKRYLMEKGANVDFAMFDLEFQTPQNFASYRQSELDNQRIGTFTQIQAIPFVSNRYAMKRFLGMSAEEIAENERYWKEENDENLSAPPTDAAGEMRGVGVSGAGITADLGGTEDVDPEAEPDPVAGGEATPPDTATGTPVGGAGTTPQQ